MPKKATTKPVKKAAVAPKAKAAVKTDPSKVAAKPAKAKAKPAKTSKPAKTGPKKGRGRVTSPSGPLSAAVVTILKRYKRPLSCREITEALLKKNYIFTHPEPGRIVSIRIYKLKGVKQVAPGRFTNA